MYIHDFNSEYKKTILLIHPILTNGQDLKKNLIDMMDIEDIRIIVPDISGHGQSKNVTYLSAVKEASMLHKYLVAKGIDEISLAFGTSLGSNIIFELLKYKDIKINSVLMESASAYQNSFIKYFIYTKALILLKNISKHKDSIGKTIISHIYDKELGETMTGELISLSNESIENMMRDYTKVDLPFLRRNVQKNLNFYYGSKDKSKKYSKKRLKSNYPKANYFEWPYFKSCEKMFREPRSYAEILKSFI